MSRKHGLMLFIMAMMPQVASAAFYDQFESGSGLIDSGLWRSLERIRRVEGDGAGGNRLYMELRAAAGSSETSSQLMPIDSSSVNSISTVATVDFADVSTALGADNEARARVSGYFCDSNNTAGDGDTGEIYAESSIVRQENGNLRFRFLLYQCADADCDTGVNFHEERIGTNGPPPIPDEDITYPLSVSFEPATQVFTMVAGSNVLVRGPADIPELSGCGVSNADFMGLGTRISSANGSGEFGHIGVGFDNVFINGVFYDNFDGSSQIDGTLWQTQEESRFIDIVSNPAEGHAVLAARAVGNDERSYLEFTDPDSVGTVRSKVEVLSTFLEDSVTNDARAAARIDGHFYNYLPSTIPGDDTGNVDGILWLIDRLDNVGRRSAVCQIYTCEVSSCSPTENFIFKNLDIQWEYNREYTLTFGFDDVTNTFHCAVDNTTFSYTLDPATDPMPLSDSTDPLKSVGVRAYRVETTAEEASIEALFDDIFIPPYFDIGPNHWALAGAEALKSVLLMEACGAGNLCPKQVATRELAALWLLRAKEGAAYEPPAVAGAPIFTDVASGDKNAAWIEALSNLGITDGCNVAGDQYCPELTVSRGSLAVLLLKTLNGSTYLPPVASGIFADLPVSDSRTAWAEDLYNQNFSSGCNAAGTMFCPNQQVTLGEFAGLLTTTFALSAPAAAQRPSLGAGSGDERPF